MYKVNAVVIAGGYEQKGRSLIHGHPIPTDHVCVLLKSAKEDHDAQCVLGDPSENGELFVRGFFALPRESLSLVKLDPFVKVVFAPYRSSNYSIFTLIGLNCTRGTSCNYVYTRRNFFRFHDELILGCFRTGLLLSFTLGEQIL